MNKHDALRRMIEINKELLKDSSRNNLRQFLRYTHPSYERMWFHTLIANKCQDLFNGKLGTNRLMVFVPPQHGKSEIVSRKFPAWILGNNPDTKVVGTSYSSELSRQFCRAIQRTMDSVEYRELFPCSLLNSQNVSTDSKRGVLRNADMFEVVGHKGFYKAVGVGGSLTGTPVDIGIIDDPIKDALSAQSVTLRERVWDWYVNVFLTRLHNDSKQLLIMTRWHEDDLAGRLLNREGDKWEVISIPAIRTDVVTCEQDPRREGEALWEAKHSLKSLEEVRQRSPNVFESLYQQDPKPAKGLMYEGGFKTYDDIQIDHIGKKSIIKNYTDTADTGSDYLCSITYKECDEAIYVLDVIYTQQSMEVTEPLLAKTLDKYKVDVCYIESNNGGRSYARNVERILRQIGNMRTRISWFFQGNNKEARIFSNSASVQNMIYFPSNWKIQYGNFADAVLAYRKSGKNAHDDAPDALTGIIEKRGGYNSDILSRLIQDAI